MELEAPRWRKEKKQQLKLRQLVAITSRLEAVDSGQLFGNEINRNPTNVLWIANISLQPDTLSDCLALQAWMELQEGFVGMAYDYAKPYQFAYFDRTRSAHQVFRVLTLMSSIKGPRISRPLIICFASIAIPCIKRINVPGLKVIPDFFSLDEANEMTRSVLEIERCHPSGAFGIINKRRALHFVSAYSYKPNPPKPEHMPATIETMPPSMKAVMQRVEAHVGRVFDQITVQCYPPGSGIPPHVDDPDIYDDPIVALAWEGDCLMDFVPVAEHQDDSADKSDWTKASIYMPALSLMIMTGESRYTWRHAIPARKIDIVPMHEFVTTKDVTAWQGHCLIPRKQRWSITARIKQPS